MGRWTMGNEEAFMRSRKGQLHYAWVMVAVVALVMAASSGVRNSFGVFIRPLEEEFGWSRTTLSVVASLSLFLYGAVGPLVGRLADRWGPRGVLAAAVALLSAGTLATAAITSLWQLYLAAGIISAFGAGGAALSVARSETRFHTHNPRVRRNRLRLRSNAPIESGPQPHRCSARAFPPGPLPIES